MEIIECSSTHIAKVNTNHRCEFCWIEFETQSKKNEHILSHFEQDNCVKCDQNLLRIGENWYVLHAKITCVELSKEEDTETKVNEHQSSSLLLVDEEVNDNPDMIVDRFNESDQLESKYNTDIEDVNPLENVEVDYIPQQQQSSNFQCQICKIYVKTKFSLDRHIIRTHNPIAKQFKCHKCELRFATKFELSRHAKKSRKKVCKYCKKIFCSVISLQFHNEKGCTPNDYTELAELIDNLENESNINHQTSLMLDIVDENSDMIMDQNINDFELNESKYIINTELNINEINVKPVQSIEEDGLSQPNIKTEMMEEENDYFDTQQNDDLAKDAQNPDISKYQCPMCKMNMKSKSRLDIHIIRIHNPETMQYKCDFCERKFATKSELNRHNKMNKQICVTCKQKFCSLLMLQSHFLIGCTVKNDAPNGIIDAKIKHIHKQQDTTDVPTCNVCSKTFLRKDHLKLHYGRVHSSSSKQHQCNECGQCFIKADFLVHKRQILICNRCGDYFCSQHLLFTHISKNCNFRNKDMIKDRQCTFNGCNEIVGVNMWKQHMTTMHKDIYKTYQCDICKKVFKVKTYMRSHILNTHCKDVKTLKCDLCQFSCVTDEALLSHKRSVHSKVAAFICSECGKTFKKKCQLVLHTYTHTGEKPFECFNEGCSKRFRSQPQRIEHMRMHTGEKPFTCPVDGCDRRFSYSIDLKRHKFSAHQIYTKKYPCQICNKIFPESMLLKKHLKNHGNQL